MQFNQGNHNHNENTEYHYYGDYVQREETHVHMHGEAMDKAGSGIYDISALHGIRKLLFVIVFAAANCIRLCSFGFFAILHLAAVIIQKFVALYLVLMGIMLISGLMGDAILCSQSHWVFSICFVMIQKPGMDTLYNLSTERWMLCIGDLYNLFCNRKYMVE